MYETTRIRVNASVNLEKGRILNASGNNYATNEPTSTIGVCAYDIEQGKEVVVYKSDSIVEIQTDDLTIVANDYLTSDANGKAKKYVGSGIIIGIARSSPKYGHVETYVFSFNPSIGTGGGGGGEANTITNIGTSGVGIYKQKTGVDLELKKVNPNSSKISITDDIINNTVDFDVAENQINHNNLLSTHNLTTDINHNSILNYVANQHIDHSTLNINTNANSGLSGGGNLTTSKTLSININGTTEETLLEDTDEFLLYDVSNTALRKISKLNLQNNLVDQFAKDFIVEISDSDFVGNIYTISVDDLGKLFVVDLSGALSDQTIKIQNATLSTKGYQTGISYRSGDVTLNVTTVGGTQLIGGSTTQPIQKSNETITLTDNETYYLIRQDSRINKDSVDVLAWNTGVTEVLDLEDETRHFLSSNRLTGGTITTNEIAGTVDISNAEWYLRNADVNDAPLKPCVVNSATGLAIPNNSTRYVLANYNAGSPNHILGDDPYLLSFQSQCPSAVVSRVNTNLDVLDIGDYATDFFVQYMRAESSTNWLKRGVGLLISEVGTRNISITAGTLYIGVKRYETPNLNTSTGGTFTYYYRNGSGGWNEQTAQTQLNITQWDNNLGTLSTGAVNKYYVHRIYVRINTPTEFAVLYPQQEFNSLVEAQANAGAISTAPSFAQPFSTGRFIGSIITKYNTIAFEDILSPFIEPLGSSTPSSHNNLSSLQGGILDQYYHLTSAQHTNITGTSTSLTNVTVTNDLIYDKNFGSDDYYVDWNSTATTKDGSFNRPYASLQNCLTAIGSPIDVTDARRKITIHIKAGQYDENITIPQQRMITLLCYGTVIIGDGNADNLYNSTVARSLTVTNTATGEPVGSPSRPAFSIKGITSETSSTHSAYGMGNMIISGDLNFNHIDGNATSHETYLCGVKVQGNVVANANELGSVHNMILDRCYFDNSFTLPNANLNIVNSCEFDGLITSTGVCRFTYCELNGGITSTMFDYYPPNGFYSCVFTAGTLTMANIKVDSNSRQSIVDNGITYTGTLTNISNLAFTDSSVTFNDNVIVDTDGSTSLQITNGVDTYKFSINANDLIIGDATRDRIVSLTNSSVEDMFRVTESGLLINNLNNANGDIQIKSTTNNNIVFIDSSADTIGLGVTPSSGSLVDINGNISVNGSIRVGSIGVPAVGYSIDARDDIRIVGADGNQIIDFNALDTTNLFRLQVTGTGHAADSIQIGRDDGGNTVIIPGDTTIGENVAVSQRQLLIYENNTNAQLIQFANSNTGMTSSSDGCVTGITSAGQGYFWNYENSSIILGTNNTQAMVIANNQNVSFENNVGIQSSTPDEDLHIGDTNDTFTIKMGGDYATFFRHSFVGGVGQRLQIGNNYDGGSFTPIMTIGNDSAVAGGNVGIGVTSPSEKLSVSGNIKGTASIYTGSISPGVGVYGSLLRNGSSDNSMLISVQTTSELAPYKIAHFYGTQGQAIIRGDGDVENTNGSYGTISDIRLKENIIDARNNYLDDIMKLRLVNFNFKGKEQKNLGLIAQEVEEIFPNLVKTGNGIEDGIENKKTIKQSIFIYLLISAVQELNKKIDELSKK